MKQTYLTWHRIWQLLLVAVLCVPLFSAVVLAQDSDESTQTSVVERSTTTAQKYGANTKLAVGTVVQPDSADSAKVIPATGNSLTTAFGVVVSSNNLQISLEQAGDEQSVYVSTSGRHEALVTNENGTIQVGDYIAISSLSGTLRKADVDQEYVFGKALAGFDGKSNVVGTTTLKDTAGNPTQQVAIGLIPISIEIVANPERVSTEANLPAALQRIGEAIAEKPVDPVRVYISIAVTTLSIIMAITLLVVGVRNSIISIGRNPLSKKSIFRGLLQVIITSVIVLIIGLFTVYLLLRL